MSGLITQDEDGKFVYFDSRTSRVFVEVETIEAIEWLSAMPADQNDEVDWGVFADC